MLFADRRPDEQKKEADKGRHKKNGIIIPLIIVLVFKGVDR